MEEALKYDWAMGGQHEQGQRKRNEEHAQRFGKILVKLSFLRALKKENARNVEPKKGISCLVCKWALNGGIVILV